MATAVGTEYAEGQPPTVQVGRALAEKPPIKWLQKEKTHRPKERPPRNVPASAPSVGSASPPQWRG